MSPRDLEVVVARDRNEAINSYITDMLALEDHIEKAIRSQLTDLKDYPELDGLHDLRTRTSGTHHFVQFHVWVPADWTVKEAHDRLDRVEAELEKRFPSTDILIHLDPEGNVDREGLLPSHIAEQPE